MSNQDQTLISLYVDLSDGLRRFQLEVIRSFMGFTTKIPLLAPWDYRFPEPSYALAECDGLVGISGDLDMGRLLLAYGQGIFPWLSHDGWFFWCAVVP